MRTLITLFLFFSICTTYAQDNFKISITDASVESNEQFCLDVLVENFDSIESMQFAIEWNVNSIDFIGIENEELDFLSMNNFNLTTTDEGYFRMVWSDQNISEGDGVSRPDGRIFSICFQSNDECITSFVEFSQTQFNLEATDTNGNALNIESKYGYVAKEGGGNGRYCDSLALVDFYWATNGPDWTTKWNLDEPLEEWYGLGFTENERVKWINLQKNNLTGNLIEFNLDSLTHFTLSKQQLEGVLIEFNGFPKIEYLYLSDIFNNDIEADPNRIILNFNLPNLKSLKIIRDKYFGAIPNFDSLPLLAVLELNYLGIEGNIPDFHFIPKLSTLVLEVNNLEGPIPDFSGLPLLRTLDLSQNDLTGDLIDFSNLDNLVILNLQNNKITGLILDFQNLSNLRELDLDRNQLEGPIPDFSKLPKLKKLSLDGNKLTGGLIDFTSLQLLETLYISQNSLTGSIPNYSRLPKLKELYLAKNSLTGQIPNFSNLPSLEILNLSENNLEGEIPNFTNLPELEELKLIINKLSEQIPNFSNLKNLKKLYMRQNNLTGTLPNFSNLPELIELHLAENNITGSIPDFSNLPRLEELYLWSNELVGLIPNFTNTPKLKDLIIADNRLGGNLPNFTSIPNLIRLRAESNQISGTVPNFIGCPLLHSIELQENSIDSLELIRLSNRIDIVIDKNQLTFSSLLKNTDNHTIRYSPQDSIPLFPEVSFNFDSQVVADIKVDPGILDNSYKWFKNTELVGTTNESKIILDDVNPMDEWVVEWNNATITDLTLISEPFHLLVNLPKVMGKVVLDKNENCTLDSIDKYLPKISIKLSNDLKDYYVKTDEKGDFCAFVDPGTYQVEAILPNSGWEHCEDDRIVIADVINDTFYQDLVLEVFDQCPQLNVHSVIQRPRLRRCFNNKIGIVYCNEGTEEMQDVLVEFSLDKYIQVDSFSVTGIIDLGDGYYKFPVSSLDIGECGNIVAFVTTDCDSDIGITQCVEAQIYPNDICNSFNELWSGPTVDISGECLDGEAKFELKNIGDSDMENALQYRLFENGVMTYSEEVILGAGNSIFLSYPGNGITYRLEMDQVEGHPCSVLPSVTIEGCAEDNLAEISKGYYLQFPEDDGCPFEDKACYLVTGPVDPNDKLAVPIGYGEKHYISAGTEIEYTVRFQNVGNDTAFNIYIADTLSTNLDFSTFELGESSHPLQLEIQNNALKFSFFDVNLVDSLTNEPASNGYVKYKIRTMGDLTEETVVENAAHIVFDFNDPIKTNTVFHTIGSNFIISDTQELFTEISGTLIYPNPARDKLAIEVSDYNGYVSIEIFNVSGRKVMENSFVEKNELPISNLESGLYFVQIKIGSKVIFKKFVKE